MSPLAPVIAQLSGEIADLTAACGRRVDVANLRVTDRMGELELEPAGGLVSPNGACRLIRARDGWVALNLARDEDKELVPAWLGCEPAEDAWALVAAHAGGLACGELRDRAVLLGLPACRVGEASAPDQHRLAASEVRLGQARPSSAGAPRVVDLSALWAGPLCGAILAAMGASVTKVESPRRPDPTRLSTPGLHDRLNGAKTALSLDLSTNAGRSALRALVHDADVVITSARRRGLESIGLDPLALLEARPGLTWVAVTGYGWDVDRVAFGDDAAAAGGLLARTGDGDPRFLGDALADPVTGLAAAAAALRGLARGGGVLVDAAMAPLAASAAAALAGEAVA